MKNTRNNIKISFEDPTYLIFGNYTKCQMRFEVKMPYILEKIAEVLIDKKFLPPMPTSCKACAYMHPKDEYNEAKGLKVSMAKAEIVAYKKVSHWMSSFITLIAERGFDVIDSFQDFSYEVIAHDKKFLKQF